MSYIANTYQDTLENDNFRKVMFTGAKSQLVVMSIPPGGEIGTETHDHVEQTLFNLKGSAKAILNGEEKDFLEGFVFVVTPGTQHNVINSGDTDLKICTVYTPANHIDGRIHATKADADTDHEDEAFGHTVN